MIKILIVEDDPILSKMYKHVLDLEKIYETYIAFDGVDALEKASGLLPHIILLDIMLPRINGFDVLEKLKSNDLTKTIPVVILSNIDESLSDQKKIVSLGALKYINKSEYDIRQLATLIKEVLDIEEHKR